MRLLDLLDALDAAGVTLTAKADRLHATGPRSELEHLGPDIAANKALLLAHLNGVRTGHALAFCETCGEPTITATKDSSGKPRSTWPTCRGTSGCGGRNQHGAATSRHRPRACDLIARRDTPAPPPQPRQAKSEPITHLLGPRPTWPTTNAQETQI